MATTTINVSEIKNIATVDTKSAIKKLKEYKKLLESFKNVQLPKIGDKGSSTAMGKMAVKNNKAVSEELKKQREHKKMLTDAEREAHKENNLRLKEAERSSKQLLKDAEKKAKLESKARDQQRIGQARKLETIDFTNERVRVKGLDKDKDFMSKLELSNQKLREGTISLKRYRHEIRMAEQAQRRMAGSTKTLGQSFKNLRSMIVTATASMTLFAEGREIVNTGLEIEGLHLALKAITKDTGKATAEYEFFRDVVQKTGLDLLSSAKSFKIFTAAASTTALKGESARNLFEETSKQIATLGLSADEAFGIFKAMGQIMSKNRVSAEELSNQLGDRLPGAVGLAAKAMNMTTKELLALVATGKLTAEEFLPKLTAAMKKANSEFEDLAENSKRIAFGRFRTAITDLRNTIFTGGLGDGLKDLANTFSDMLKKSKVLGNFLGGTFRGILLGLALPVMFLVAAFIDLSNIISKLVFGKPFKELNKTNTDMISLAGTIGGLVLGLWAFVAVSKVVIGTLVVVKGILVGLAAAAGIAVSPFVAIAAGIAGAIALVYVFRDELKKLANWLVDNFDILNIGGFLKGAGNLGIKIKNEGLLNALNPFSDSDNNNTTSQHIDKVRSTVPNFSSTVPGLSYQPFIMQSKRDTAVNVDVKVVPDGSKFGNAVKAEVEGNNADFINKLNNNNPR